MTLTRLGGIVGPFPTPEQIAAQGFDFRPSWWIPRIPEPSWTTVLDSLPEAERRSGYRHITRADPFAAADAGLPHGALLVAVYAWGGGDRGFLVGRYSKVFRDNSPATISTNLAAAHETLTEYGPQAAYESLSRYRRNWLPGLGQSFFTKLLYLLDRRDGTPGRALILDQFVATALNDIENWGLKEQGDWTGEQYTRWLDYAHDQAAQASEAEGREVRPDAVEMAMFRYGQRFDQERRKARKGKRS